MSASARSGCRSCSRASSASRRAASSPASAAGIGRALDRPRDVRPAGLRAPRLCERSGDRRYLGAWAAAPGAGRPAAAAPPAHLGRGDARLVGDPRAARLGLSDSLVWPLALVAAGSCLLSGATFGLEERRARVAALSLVVAGSPSSSARTRAGRPRRCSRPARSPSRSCSSRPWAVAARSRARGGARRADPRPRSAPTSPHAYTTPCCRR